MGESWWILVLVCFFVNTQDAIVISPHDLAARPKLVTEMVDDDGWSWDNNE